MVVIYCNSQLLHKFSKLNHKITISPLELRPWVNLLSRLFIIIARMKIFSHTTNFYGISDKNARYNFCADNRKWLVWCIPREHRPYPNEKLLYFVFVLFWITGDVPLVDIKRITSYYRRYWLLPSARHLDYWQSLLVTVTSLGEMIVTSNDWPSACHFYWRHFY